jgi:hypothetical protein
MRKHDPTRTVRADAGYQRGDSWLDRRRENTSTQDKGAEMGSRPKVAILIDPFVRYENVN